MGPRGETGLPGAPGEIKAVRGYRLGEWVYFSIIFSALATIIGVGGYGLYRFINFAFDMTALMFLLLTQGGH